MISDEITELLQWKQKIDQGRSATNNMASYDAWVTEALELLLRAELERQSEARARGAAHG